MNCQRSTIKDLQHLYEAENEQASRLPQLAHYAASKRHEPHSKSVPAKQQHGIRLKQIFETRGEADGGREKVSRRQSPAHRSVLRLRKRPLAFAATLDEEEAADQRLTDISLPTHKHLA
jgi:hypothetical protein